MKTMRAPNRSWFALLSLVLFMGGSCFAQSAKAGAQSFSGEIIDDLCAKDKSHENMMAEMKSMGKDAATCSRKCIELGAKYVLYDRQSDTIYAIENQDKAEAFAGQKVHISGTLEKKKIKIASIEAAETASAKSK